MEERRKIKDEQKKGQDPERMNTLCRVFAICLWNPGGAGSGLMCFT